MATKLNLRAVARRSTLLAVVSLLVAFTGTAAAATTRFASPSGDPTASQCTSAAAPCSLAAALSSAQDDDGLSLAAGSYDVSAVQLPPARLHWMSTDPHARPTLTSSAAAPTVALTPAQSGSSFDGLEIDNTNTTSTSPEPALLVLSGVDAAVRRSVVKGRHCVDAPGMGTVTIDASTLSATGAATCASLGAMSIVRNSTVSRPSATISRDVPEPVAVTTGVFEDTTVTGGLDLAGPMAVARRVRASGSTGIGGQGLVVDSLATGAAPDGAGIAADAPEGGTLRVVNSTAVNPNGPALLASPSAGPGDAVTPNDLEVTDTIAHGGTADIEVNDRFARPLGAVLEVIEPGRMEIDHSAFATRMPLATARDGALISEGVGNVSADPRFADPAAGNFHLRIGSPAIDAGIANPLARPADLDGDERVQGRAPDLGAFESSPAATTPPPPPPPLPSHAKPVLSKLRISPGAIRASRTRGGPRRRSARITFTLSRPAIVTLSFARAMPGGRFVTAGNVTVHARAGATAIRFTGTLSSGRMLAPGAYRLTATPVGAGNNVGRARSARLTLLPLGGKGKR